MRKIGIKNPVHVKKRKSPTLSLKVEVLLKSAVCQIEGCDSPLSAGVEYDHKKPLELGGDNVVDNIQAICVSCHRKKTSKDVSEIRRAARRQKKLLTGRSTKGSGKKLKSRGFSKTLKKKFSGEIIKLDEKN